MPQQKAFCGGPPFGLSYSVGDRYRAIKSAIEGDMLRRAPGQFLSKDATFKLAKVTIKESKGQGRGKRNKAKMLTFLLGENNDVVACGALSPPPFLPFHILLHVTDL